MYLQCMDLDISLKEVKHFTEVTTYITLSILMIIAYNSYQYLNRTCQLYSFQSVYHLNNCIENVFAWP